MGCNSRIVQVLCVSFIVGAVVFLAVPPDPKNAAASSPFKVGDKVLSDCDRYEAVWIVAKEVDTDGGPMYHLVAEDENAAFQKCFTAAKGLRPAR